MLTQLSFKVMTWTALWIGLGGWKLSAEEVFPVVIIQISESALTKLIDQEISDHSPVNDNFQGTHLVGQALTVGRPRIILSDDEKAAAFQVILQGSTTSQTRGSHPPVELSSRAITHFTASTRIEFVPGKGFRASPAEIVSTTETFVDQIDTCHRGLLRRIILRRAWAETAASRTAANEFARTSAEKRILAAFDLALKEQLTQLNRATDIRQIAEKDLHSNLPPFYQCSTKQGCLQLLLPSQIGKPCETKLPALPGDSQPIHLWLHKSLLGPELKNGLTWLDNVGAELNHIMNQPLGSMAVKALAPNATPRLASAISLGNSIHWDAVDDWIVIHLSEEGIVNTIRVVSTPAKP